MTTGEFVSNLGHFHSSHLDFDKAAHFFISGKHDLVNVALLGVFQWDGPVLEFFSMELLLGKVVKLCLGNRGNFSNNDIITTNLGAWANDTIFVQLLIRAMLAA